MGQCDCEKKTFSVTQKELEKFLVKKKSIALNVLYIPHNREKVRHVYISKHNSTRENKVILLMITDGENGIILL